MEDRLPEAIALARERAGSADLRRFTADLLRELVAIDTTPRAEIDAIAASEAACFAAIEGTLAPWLPRRARIARVPIPASIAADPAYTRPHYTATRDRPEGLPPRDAYRGRANLIVTIPGIGGGGRPCIYNAHIDTVAPHIPPRLEGGRVCGRGACDDKGGVALLLAGIRVMAEIEGRLGLAVASDRIYAFVIEEETGGNGSLAVAAMAPGAEVVVIEPTQLVPHPAGRGAVWYQIRIGRRDPRLSLAGIAARIVLALEEEGARLRAESDHPLFRPDHVQTCQGILGPFGAHPSAVNDRVVFAANAPPDRVEPLLDEPLAAYTARYGDKTREIDEATGGPKVPRHVALAPAPRGSRIEVLGKAGHMGAIARCDCALVKGAYLATALEDAGIRVEIEGVEAGEVILEGGQGFLPTHPMQEVMRRLTEAAERGAAAAAARAGLGKGAAPLEVRFEKLHNDAYASPVDAPAMEAFRAAFEALDRPWPAPRGFEVSCDARLFHHAGHHAIVWGPGELARAHADGEFLDLDEAAEALAIHAVAALALGGLASPPQETGRRRIPR